MPRQCGLFLLSAFRIPSLERDQPFSEFVAEDLIELIQNATTKIVTEKSQVGKIMEKYPYLKHVYQIQIMELK